MMVPPGFPFAMNPQPKPAKGTAFIERKERRKATVAEEDAAKREVRRKDQRCRWPFCTNCKAYKPRLEVAHVVRAKGMGGDHGTVSTPADMMLLDALTHANQEQHLKRVEPLTDEGTRGPCEFWSTDVNGEWYLVAREVAPFEYERD